MFKRFEQWLRKIIKEELMATVAEVQSAVVAAASTVTSIETSISQLKAQLANPVVTPSGIDPASLDTVLQDLQNLNTNLSTLSTNVASLVKPTV